MNLRTMPCQKCENCKQTVGFLKIYLMMSLRSEWEVDEYTCMIISKFSTLHMSLLMRNWKFVMLINVRFLPYKSSRVLGLLCGSSLTTDYWTCSIKRKIPEFTWYKLLLVIWVLNFETMLWVGGLKGKETERLF